MDGYLYQIIGDEVEELYWSSKELNEGSLRDAYKEWEDSDNYEIDCFEDWWNIGTSNIKIERVFVEEIFIK